MAQFVLALAIAAPVILFPAVTFWYLEISSREAAVAERRRKKNR